MALKTLSSSGDEELRERMRREGQAQARVSAHPNVVRIYEQGEEQGRPYLVMELATGGDLHERLRNGPLPVSVAVELARDLARGVAHMHAQGIVHRDLKPANVLFDEAGVPKLVDFGLARFAGAATLTNTGDVMGTPGYMSPEQALGVRSEIGPKTDVHALGALLYAALKGVPPFGFGASGSTMDLLQRVIEEEPPPPSALRPEVQPALDALCRSFMAKDASERPTAAEAVARLEALLVGLAPRAVRRARRRTDWRSLAFMAIGLLAFAGAAALRFLPDAPAGVSATSAGRGTGGTALGELPAAGAPQEGPTGATHGPAEPAREGAGGSPSGWRLAQGDRLRWAVTLAYDLDYPFRTTRFDYTLRLVLGCEVTSADADRAELTATVEQFGLAATLEAPTLPAPFQVDFDSARADDAERPLARAVGGTLQLGFDLRSGAVLALEGADWLQTKITEGLDALERGRHRLVSFPSAATLRAVLEATLRALPPASGERQWVRSLTASDPLGAVEQLSRRPEALRFTAPPPVATTFHVRQGSDTRALQVGWSGVSSEEVEPYPYEQGGNTFLVHQRTEHARSGEARFAHGRQLMGRTVDEWSCTYEFVAVGQDRAQRPLEPTRARAVITLQQVD